MTVSVECDDRMAQDAGDGVIVEVVREDLIRRVRGTADRSVVLVEAPAAYGKTTFLSQWAARDQRPFVRLAMAPRHSYVQTFVADLSAALRAHSRVFDGDLLADADRDARGDQLTRLGTALGDATAPFVVVLDGLDRVGQPAVSSALPMLVRHVPPGSLVVLVARDVRALLLGNLATRRNTLHIGAVDLAFSDAEAAALFRGAGLDLRRDEILAVVQMTEGWPGALAIAAQRLGSSRVARVDALTGNDRMLADFVEDAVLAPLSARQRAVLTAGAVLGEWTAEGCNALLGTRDSGDVLADLARQSALLAPASRDGARYRLHTLVADVLRAGLAASDPVALREMHSAGCTLCEQRHDLGAAVDHALAADERARAAEIMWRTLAQSVGSADAPRFRSWLDHWGDDESAVDPLLCCMQAWCALGIGDTSSVTRWVERARRARPDAVLPGGTPLLAALALLEGMIGDEVTHILENARIAQWLDDPADAGVAVAMGLEGASLRLLGDLAGARRKLEEALDYASILVPTLRSTVLVQLALVAIEERRYADAQELVDQASETTDREQASGRPETTLLTATRAWLGARRGPSPAVAADAEHSLRVARSLGAVLPLMGIEARILVSGALARLGSYRQARVALAEAQQLLFGRDDAGTLPERLRVAVEQMEAPDVPVGLAAEPLTPAELRVLRLLPTHLSFPEIAEQLYLSRHTVKTHAVAVYAKLGVNTRADAVSAARRFGLVE